MLQNFGIIYRVYKKKGEIPEYLEECKFYEKTFQMKIVELKRFI